jgi:hypothetical protein
MPIIAASEFALQEGVAHSRFAVSLASGGVWNVDGSIAVPIVVAIEEGKRQLLLVDAQVNDRAHKFLVLNLANVVTIEHVPR